MTARALVAYHSMEGQAAKVAERVAASLRRGGLEVDVRDAADAPSPEGYDLLVVGDSIHAGRHSRELGDYLGLHEAELSVVPTALFQVCLTSAVHDEQHDATAARFVDELREATGVRPRVVGLFGGALAYTRYGWFKRQMMRLVARKEGGSTDTSRDHDLTDWAEVDRFAAEALALVPAQQPSS